jgi:outer membrane receptor for ferrienterochelin and colicins
MSPGFRSLFSFFALAGLLIATDGLAAQSGTLTGRVVDAETNQPLASVSVQVLGSGGQQVASVLSGSDGQFRASVDAGTYALLVSFIGYETQRLDGISVDAGATESVAVSLRSRVFILNPIVATVGRVPEKAVEAPASVAVVGEEEIRLRPATTPADHLRSVPGVDIATHGLQSGNVVVRGFNNIFSGALHTLTDHRIAGIPSLRVNLMHFIPSNDEDIERMEVVLGPGSALYGPNTANGVLHIFTRSPLQDQSTSFSIAGGERSLFHTNFRTSHLLSDNLGLKVSGQYLRGDEWEHTDPQEVVERDFSLERWSGEVRADWQVDDATTAVFSVGRTNASRSIELTGIGAAQVRDWAYTYYQARLTRDRLFGQVYLNTSDAGDTFILRSNDPIVDQSKLLVSQLQHGTALGERQDFIYGVDYIRTMPETGGTVHGRNEDDDQYDEYGIYIQSQTSLTPTLTFTAAGRMDWHSVLPDPVFSPRAALVYSPREGQSFRATYNKAFSTPTSTNLFLDINAGPFPDATLANLGFGTRAQGTRDVGFSFRRADGSLTGMRSPFNPQGRDQLIPADPALMWQIAVGVLAAQGAIDQQTAGFLLQQNPTGQVGLSYLDVLASQAPVPLTDDVSFDFSPIQESNTTTWEVGYKGILGERLLLAADVWYQQKDNFVSALRPVTPLLFLEGQSLAAFAGPRIVQHLMERGMPMEQAQETAGALITGMASIPIGVLSSEDVSSAANSSDFLVTYRNFGEVDMWGVDLSARFLVDDLWTVGVAASWVDKDHFETEGERIALNAPARKLSASLGYRDARRGLNGELRVRHNSEFPVLSAPSVATACLGDTGPLVEPCVSSFTLLDLSLGYRLAALPGASVQLGIQNLLDEGYRSFAGVPEIGRMALLRLRYEF